MAAADFQPNRQALDELMGMGFDRETATQALFFSGNNGSDTAVAWIFDNQGQSPNFGAAFMEGGAAGNFGPMEAEAEGEFKLVIVVNSSLKMTTGKVSAQVAHAALGAYRIATGDESAAVLHRGVRKWEQEGEVTIVLSGENAPHLEALERRATDHGLVVLMVSDAGRTQVAFGAKTALAVFGETAKVDRITGSLRPL